MQFDFRISIYVLAAAASIVYAVSWMPSLTNGGNAGSGGISEAEFETLMIDEQAYCERMPQSINCECFAKRSSLIQSHRPPRVPTATYANPQDLARGQAEQAC
ncbi:MAG: hypothetical protein ABJL67_03930 [Sulfitobacter sp.]